MYTNPKDKIATLDREELKYLLPIIDSFLVKEIVKDDPKLVFVTGGIASGKTSIIKDEYIKDHVYIDAAQVHLKITDNETKKPDKYNAYFDFIGMMLVENSIKGKKNIVIEITGNQEIPIEPIIDKLIAGGYKVEMKYIHCDPVVAWDRNLKRDKLNISAAFTQDQTLSWFDRFLGLE